MEDRRAPPIAQALSIPAGSLEPVGRKVIIEADRRDKKVGSLWVPAMNDEIYPTTGWVLSVGSGVTELKSGDFVLIEAENHHIERTYYDLFEIVLRHEDGLVETIWVDVETEPVIREQWLAFRRGGLDSTISVVDKKVGGSISFNCSNILDMQIGDMANPQYDLSYVPVFMVEMTNEDMEPALYYFTEPERILAIVEY